MGGEEGCTREEERKSQLVAVEKCLACAWTNGGQTMLFALMGGAIELDKLTPEAFRGAAVICLALAIRLVAVLPVVSCSGWSFKECLFTAVTWGPKATVQAALSTVALEHVQSNMDRGMATYEEQEKRALLLLQVAVLS